VADAEVRRSFQHCWGPLPAEPGYSLVEMLQEAKEGRIKGMYIVGENPVRTLPDTAFVHSALGALDFLVVQDLFLTATAKLAKVVLPAASFAEKEGTFTSFDGRIKSLQRAVAPPGESLADWEIILRLAEAMGCPLPYQGLQDVREEIAKLVPAYRETGFAGKEAVCQVAATREPVASPVYCKQPAVTARFWSVGMPEPAKEDPSFPFVLLTGSSLFHFGTGERSGRARRLRRYYHEQVVYVGEADAARLALRDGEKVKVISAAGEVLAVVKVTDTLPQGLLFAPLSPAVDLVGRLFAFNIEPLRKAPLTKMVNVRIERVGSNE